MILDIIFIIIISVLVVSCVFNIFTIMHYRDKINYYHRIIERVMMNDDIIDSSFYTLSTAYGIEEGDLKNYICEVQKHGTNTNRGPS